MTDATAVGVSASLPGLATERLPPVQRGGVLRPLRGLSDDRLTALAARGDDDAFAMIATRYRPAIVRYCSSILLNAADAEDAAQTTMVKARAGLGGRGREPIKLRPWLFRIAHNEAVSLLRARRPTESLDAFAEVLSGPGEDALGVRARTHALVADLLELPERQRAALLMRELVGLSYGEIAGALGGTAAAITQSVFEGRRNLAQIEHGRALECSGVQRSISDGDERRLRGRALRAHIQDCHDCNRFATSITQRTITLGLIFPLGAKGGLIAGAGMFGGAGAPAAVSAFGAGGAAPVAKAVAVAAVLAGVGAGGVAVQQATVHHGTTHSQAHHVAAVRPAAPRLVSAVTGGARATHTHAPAHHPKHHRSATRKVAPAPPSPTPKVGSGTISVGAGGASARIAPGEISASAGGANARIAPSGISASTGDKSASIGPKGISAQAGAVSVGIADGCIRIKIGDQVIPFGACSGG